MSLEQIISGGQTGVDRAALDVALRHGVACGGWCPRGRRAEDGSLPPSYPLVETPSRRYSQRTVRNVRDSDATLIIVAGEPSGGTALTRRLAAQLDRPCLVVDPEEPGAVTAVCRWLDENAVCRLNVAGPRESQQPGIYLRTITFLDSLLSRLADPA